MKAVPQLMISMMLLTAAKTLLMTGKKSSPLPRAFLRSGVDWKYSNRPDMVLVAASILNLIAAGVEAVAAAAGSIMAARSVAKLRSKPDVSLPSSGGLQYARICMSGIFFSSSVKLSISSLAPIRIVTVSSTMTAMGLLME